uniref:Natural cytotoxicity triggering receptor 3 n=1 Tax=Leptobrachium leishanense TaxID=445787 RepID=A0A8C5PXW1_9ANUR
MKCVELIITLGALTGVHSQSLQVSQAPMVNAREGGSVTLECNYLINRSNNETIGWYKWYRHLLHGDEVSNTTGDYKGRVSMASPSDFIEKASANIILHNVSITDTGKYICQVNINERISGHGNGTFLNVSDSISTGQESEMVYAYSTSEAVRNVCHSSSTAEQQEQNTWTYNLENHQYAHFEPKDKIGMAYNKMDSNTSTYCEVP